MIERRDSLILKMVTMLTKERINQKTIINVLEFICNSFKFDHGAVYEINQQKIFNIKEKFSINGIDFLKSFCLQDLLEGSNEIISANSIVYINQEKCKSIYEQRILNFFGCKSAVIAHIDAENGSVHGMIVLLNTSESEVLADEDIETLNTLILLVSQHLGSRLYKNMIEVTKTSMECILNHTGIDIYVNDFYTHEVLYVNESMAAPYGGEVAFEKRKCWEVLFPGSSGECEFCPQKMLVDNGEHPRQVYKWDYQRPFDGLWFRVFSSAFRWTDGRLAHMVCSADITESKKNEELIVYMANYDSLTDLPNRRKLIVDCDKLINNVTNAERSYVLFFDIDGFKKINDSYGHDVGDEFLIKLSAFFSEIPLLKGSIYRNGGDEFVAIIGGKNITQEHIKNLVGFIHERFKKKWQLKSGEVYCNTSVGVACFPQDGSTAEELLFVADKAMYLAKEDGGGIMRFGHEIVDT